MAIAKLTKALLDSNAPSWMVANAMHGYYGDFTSELDFPITALVEDAMKVGLRDIARCAMSGEFDGE